MNFKLSRYTNIHDMIEHVEMNKKLMEEIKSCALLPIRSSALKICDLTRGKYDFPYQVNYYKNMEEVEGDCSNFVYLFQTPRADYNTQLRETPIFLVESSMANEFVAVPGCECSVRVPEDKYKGMTSGEFDIDEWVASKDNEFSNKKDDPRERMPSSMTIMDLLGVYVSLGDTNAMPRRIFIWLDKIAACAKTLTKVERELGANTMALYELVLYHEIAHALMDVELYGLHPSPYFSYSKDCVYRFIEEAHANGIALSIVYGDLSEKQKEFIEEFVENQGRGYSNGWYLKQGNAEADTWMAIKILFNMEYALLLREMWKDNNDRESCHISKYFGYRSVRHDGWLSASIGLGDEWRLIELSTHKQVDGFKKYGCFETFDKYGLCMVGLDKYVGYVNEQGAEQITIRYEAISTFGCGVAFAKLNGKYGVIDIHNQTKVPFNLDYDSISGIHHGYASMKDQSGKWGVINTNGHVVLPCQYDFPVSFDEDGVAQVKKDEETFLIDTRGNRLV